jgi:hypothetical protein
MRRFAAVVAVALSLPAVLAAQVRDTLLVGDRVRVRVAETRAYTSVFIGRIAAISPETLTLEIPRDKGTMIFPRASIGEIDVPNGRASRWTNVAMTTPLLVPPVVIATLPVSSGPRRSSIRNRNLVMAGLLFTAPVAAILRRQPAERWEPVYRWLDAK